MAEKKKRGRPRLDITDAERTRRAREINKKIASKTHMVRVSLDIAKRFDEAKEARLKYEVIGKHLDQYLVEIRLETGRKHQIRVQFEAIGCPIVGDRKYNSPASFQPGIALHSRRLGIAHPTSKKRMSFETLPGDWWQLGRFGELSN